MRNLLHLSLWALAWLLLQPAGWSRPASEAYEEANRQYQEGRYAQALENYQEALDGGLRTGHVYYNLGNAAYRQNDLGAAALNYERALLLEPSLREAQENLELVHAKTGARMSEPHWSEVLLPRWTGSTYAVVAAVLGWGMLLSFAWLLLRRPGQGSATASTVLMLCTLVAAWAALGIWRDATLRQRAIVLPAQAIARTDAADRTAAVTTLPAGSHVRVLNSYGEWAYCQLPEDRRGWLPRSAIATLAAPRP